MAHVITLDDYASDAEPGLFARLLQKLADFRVYRATYGELDALSDRELADIGMSRLNVADVARQSAYGN